MAEEPNSMMFSPVTTKSNCDPTGQWFELQFRSSMGRSATTHTHYMFRENVTVLRDQLNKLLEETADGKVRADPGFDIDAAKAADAQERGRLSKPPRARKTQGEVNEEPREGTDETPYDAPVLVRHSGQLKAARLTEEPESEPES